MLVVDDEPLMLRSLERLLKRDYDVVTASGGFEVIRMLRTDMEFDAIICDLGLPEFGGQRVYAALSDLAPGLARRLLFFTGGATTREAHDFLHTTAAPVVQKPASRRQICDAVSRLVADAPAG